VTSSAKIKDPAHAVRVLESLVERGEELLMGLSDGPWYWQNGSLQSSGEYDVLAKPTHFLHDRPMLAQGRSLVPALVEGAKAVLDEYRKVYILVFDKATADDMAHINQADEEAKEKMLVALAQAYAPRMKEAGMEVPE